MLNRIRQSLMRLGALATIAMLHGMSSSNAASAQTPVERFVEHVARDDAVPPEAAKLIQQAWAECEGCDGDEFVTQGLAVLSEGFRAGLDAYQAGHHEQAARVMASLRDSEDPFIGVHAAAYEIKALVAADQLLEALERIEAAMADGGERLTKYTYLASEIAFLQGFALLSDLQYAEADQAFRSFLADFPDASQRLVISAEQMLLELQNRQPERIGEVVDLMDFAARRLALRDTGERVRTRQERVIELLDQLIEEAEQQEQSSSSSSSGGGGSRGGQGGSNSQQPSNPMQQSQLPGGPGSQGELNRAPRANPAEMWGAMPPAERERILQALRDSFPSRYRRLVEQYYEELAKKP